MRKIRVLIKRPRENPYVTYVSDKLECYQKIVGGYIDVVPLYGSVVVVCNEEGLLNSLPCNCYFDQAFWFGTIFFVCVDGDEFADCPSLQYMKSLLPTLWN